MLDDTEVGFDDVWRDVEGIGGWLTRDQGLMLWRDARRLAPGSLVVEIGSHQGRSTCVIGRAVRTHDGRVTAIDPFVEGRLFGGQPTRALFETNMRANDLEEVVGLVPRKSTDLRAEWSGTVDMLYIDGKHDYWTVTDDLLWSRSCREGAPVLVHDAYSSVGVTLALVRHVLLGGVRLRYTGRAGSLARFEVGSVTNDDRRRMLRELPWWARNVVVKVLLRLRLRPLARAIGHEGSADPY